MIGIEYLHLQMRLEGHCVKPNHLMTMVEPSGDEIPLVLMSRTFDGLSVRYLSDALPHELQRELDNVEDTGFLAAGPIVDLMCSHGIRVTMNIFQTYVFPQRYTNAEDGSAKCFSKADPQIIEFGFDKLADHVYAIEENGRVLSACVSVRQNSESAEAWVLTSPEHRRKGFAQLVVTAWAKDMMREGLVPFYSHRKENIASASLARKLGLIQVFEELSISRKKE